VFKTGDVYTIHIFSHNYQTFVDRGLRIAFTISDCAYSLKDLAYTEDLKSHWEHTMFINNYLGCEFLMKYLGVPEQVVNSKTRIEEEMFEMLDFLATRYLRLWELIDLSFSKIKKLIKNCPPTAESLFLKIAEYERLKSFEVLMEYPYVEYAPSQTAKLAEELNQNLPNIETIDSLMPHYAKNNHDNPINEVLEVCYKVSKKKNPKIALAIETYELSMKYYWKAVKNFSMARSRDGNKVLKTFISKNGVFKKNSYGR
jgi:hypothetical protein